MEKLSVNEIAMLIGGNILCGDERNIVDSVCIDSRKAVPGCLFVAMKGKRTDGSLYIKSAFEKGAVAAISEDEVYAENGAVIKVRNSLNALQGLATSYRQKFDLPVVAVTGSVGKSSTKDLCHLVLSQQFKTLKNEGNLNSDIGMPLTAFGLDRTYEAAVFEMGMSHLSEIEAMSKIAKPYIGIITNVGVSHIENLGSRENILKAKLEVEAGMLSDGTLIINGDDEMLWNSRNKIVHKYYSCGIDNKNCDFIAKDIKEDSLGSEFTVVSPYGEYRCAISEPGIHMVRNALCAFAAGVVLGIPFELIAKGISEFKNPSMHLNVIEKSGYNLINDCYNAGPESMRAALSVLGLRAKGRKIAVLASMLELGEISKEEHYKLGTFAADKTDILLCYGKEAKEIINGAKSVFPDINCAFFKTSQECSDYLAEIAKEGDTVLFKGSRMMATEKCLSDFCSKKRID